MPRWFGTDGLRGESYFFPLDLDTLTRLGFFLGDFLKTHDFHTLLVARDTRKSGPDLSEAFLRGLQWHGIRILDAGIFPTPATIFLARHWETYAVIFTASHNPYPDNGVKIVSPEGEKIPEDLEEQLEEGLAQQCAVKTVDRVQREEMYRDALSTYTQHVQNLFHDIRTDMHIYMDTAHGATYRVYPYVAEQLGFHVHTYFNEPNGVNINESCGALHPETLLTLIQSAPHDVPVIGFSFDGDGDRVLISHREYGILDGHHYLALASCVQKHQNILGSKNALVSTVMANKGLELFLNKQGVELIRTKVGDKYVMSALKEHELNIGGEPSGHFILRALSPAGDGLITALWFVHYSSLYPDAFEKVMNEYHPLPQRLHNVRTHEKPDLTSLATFQETLATYTQLLGENGRILVRYSGTEPVLRIMVEGPDEELLIEITQALEDAFRKDTQQPATQH